MQQTVVGTTYRIEVGQMLSGHKLRLFVAKCDKFASFWCKFILIFIAGENKPKIGMFNKETKCLFNHIIQECEVNKFLRFRRNRVRKEG